MSAGPEHEFESTPMNERRCWKCGLELTNSVHDFTSASDTTMEEYMAQENEYYFQKGLTQGNVVGDSNARESMRLEALLASVHGPVATPWEHQERAIYTTESMEAEINQMLSAKEEEYPHRDAVSDEKPEPTFHGMKVIVDEELTSFLGADAVFFNPSAFYIDDDSRLWAKTDKGDELITQMPNSDCVLETTGEPIECSHPYAISAFIYNKKHPNDPHLNGPCSCLAHRSENCSECFDGPSVVPSVPKAYMPFPAGMNPTYAQPETSRTFVAGDTVFVVGPSNGPTPEAIDALSSYFTEMEAESADEDVFEPLAQMDVEDLLDEVIDITQSIYPNQSEALLPKFEMVLRAVYERLADSLESA